jgi:hypothetical protein
LPLEYSFLMAVAHPTFFTSISFIHFIQCHGECAHKSVGCHFEFESLVW